MAVGTPPTASLPAEPTRSTSPRPASSGSSSATAAASTLIPQRFLPKTAWNWGEANALLKRYSGQLKRLPLRHRRSFTDHTISSSHWKPRRFSTLRRRGGFRPKVTDYVLDIRPTDDKKEMRESIINALPRILPSWKRLPTTRLEVERLSGAMTNVVYKLTVTRPPSDTDSSVTQAGPPAKQYLLRIYGQGVDELFEREKELYWLRKLSELGIGPRMLGIFRNGRLEQYLDSNVLTKDDIRDPTTSRHIAHRLCELHSIVYTFPPRPGCIPELWVNIDKWYPLVRRKLPGLRENFPHRTALLDKLQVDDLVDDIAKLRARVTAINSPLVFTHNDLQYGNLLRLKDGSDELVVIDFEYAGYNYRGYDIANHFCEWAADYHSATPHRMDFNRYPSRDEQVDFLNAYIDEQVHLNPTGCPPEFAHDRPRALAQLLSEVACFRIASHLVWGLWGLMQASASSIDFDYLEYAQQRLEAFRRDLNAEQKAK
ncbi:hypothetical protein IWQ60_009887 [Tieghemiomyces parasiticus]|uniref:Choline kinase n=1 Tax=Tieghemiomyces parasiticus TaxID=78921 RepID=A0A9W7ZS81_9FUNG|nr:hypothetical protein IWQ60_009887 [Tieghemiomyces parasiticus]